jgi:hypothetical protein
MLDERASQRDALLLAAGQFVWVSPVKPLKPDQAEHLLYTGFALAAWEVSKAERNIVLDTQVGEERVFLKDHADVPVFRGHQGI